MKPFNRANAVAFAAAMALSLWGCGRGKGRAGAPDAGATLLGPESIAVVKRDVIIRGPRVAGSLEPERQSFIRAELSGPVLEVKAEIGQPVKQGELLARIDDRAIRDAYSSAKSQVSTAENDLALAERQRDRTEKLAGAGALSDRDLELAKSAATSAQTRLLDARARLAQTKKQLDAARVTSPLTGVVSQAPVHEGDIVAPGALLFVVIDPSSMRLEASVPSDQLAALALGAPVVFGVRGFPGQTFEGRIERIAPAADPTTRQISILVSIPNPGGKLLSSLFAEGRVAAERRDGLVVPAGAVERSSQGATVMRVRGERVERVAVQIGLEDPQTERVEVASGLEAGDVVLVGTARALTPGTPVQLTAQERAAVP